MKTFNEMLHTITANALEEDIGGGDITSMLTVPENLGATADFVLRVPAVICGINIVHIIFKIIDPNVEITTFHQDGNLAQEGVSILKLEGRARSILSGERVALNFLQHMCGIATITNKFVEAVKHTKATILDTRKTTPGLRILEKYAVTKGGGQNHRMRMDDGILIKDNHISICGSIETAIIHAKQNAPKDMIVQVECDTVEQVERALFAGADRLLLDNMSLENLRDAVRLTNCRAILEASGGVTLETVSAIAETGVDYISVGAITHSAPNIDIGLDILTK